MNDYKTAILMDNDVNLPDDKRLIAKYEDIFVKDGESESTMMMKLCLNEDVKGALAKHNGLRGDIDNIKTLERTGAKVKLQPIEITDVTVLVK